MTEFFHIKRGLRQGCTLSAYLFIICIALLAAAVRENKNIGGISLFGNDFKSAMFADDATFALDGTFNSFQELIDVLEAFKSVSGLKLNNKKHCPTKRVFIFKDNYGDFSTSSRTMDFLTVFKDN